MVLFRCVWYSDHVLNTENMSHTYLVFHNLVLSCLLFWRIINYYLDPINKHRHHSFFINRDPVSKAFIFPFCRFSDAPRYGRWYRGNRRIRTNTPCSPDTQWTNQNTQGNFNNILLPEPFLPEILYQPKHTTTRFFSCKNLKIRAQSCQQIFSDLRNFQKKS
jgi:hypothetical protein